MMARVPRMVLVGAVKLLLCYLCGIVALVLSQCGRTIACWTWSASWSRNHCALLPRYRSC
jgi:hypothetical protein